MVAVESATRIAALCAIAANPGLVSVGFVAYRWYQQTRLATVSGSSPLDRTVPGRSDRQWYADGRTRYPTCRRWRC